MAQSLIMRPATTADLAAITDLALAALPDDPHWPYRFPHAQEFPEDHYKYTRIRYNTYLENAESIAEAAMVVEAPSNEDAAIRKIIAMSMWALPSTHRTQRQEQKTGNKAHHDPCRRDCDFARMRESRKQLEKAKQDWFEGRFGERQLRLMVLATHQEYRRRGSATMMVKWGQEKAEREGLALTVLASPMGQPFYNGLGFIEVGTVHIQAEGDKESRDIPGLIWVPSDE